jgi:hypothetical protein
LTKAKGCKHCASNGNTTDIFHNKSPNLKLVF